MPARQTIEAKISMCLSRAQAFLDSKHRMPGRENPRQLANATYIVLGFCGRG
jgi:hypothetical protein